MTFPIPSKPALAAIGLCLLAQLSPASAAPSSGIFDFADLAERNSDAIVNIEVVQDTGKDQDSSQSPDSPNDWFRRFFERFPEKGSGPMIPRTPRESRGSGFIYDSDGYIITNNHVARGEDRIIRVSLADRRVFEAELVGGDERSDIAVLKIEAKKLPTVRIGDSAKVRVGEWVMAIGSPFGFDYTVTKGIVSAKQRSVRSGRDRYVPFFQTDVPINPGNSGGPLFNLDGEVIGVNSQIYTRTGSFAGISFAIPINLAMTVARQLRESGKVVRGWLGVSIQEVTFELADSFSTGRPHGALVSKVFPGSPAHKGGLKVGDIIHEFEGTNINRSAELPMMVGAHPAGTDARLGIIRRGKKTRLTVEIGELPDEDKLAELDKSPLASLDGDAQSYEFAGLSFADLSEPERAKAGIDKGVKILSVSSSAKVTRAGFRPNDVVLSVNNEAVANVDQLEGIIDKAKPDSYLAFLVSREGRTIFLTLQHPG